MDFFFSQCFYFLKKCTPVAVCSKATFIYVMTPQDRPDVPRAKGQAIRRQKLFLLPHPLDPDCKQNSPFQLTWKLSPSPHVPCLCTKCPSSLCSWGGVETASSMGCSCPSLPCSTPPPRVGSLTCVHITSCF